MVNKWSNIKFHENPCSGSRVVQRGRTDGRTVGRTDGRTDGQTDMPKLIPDFRNFAKKPKNGEEQLFRKTEETWKNFKV
jgi:hypothetical protein